MKTIRIVANSELNEREYFFQRTYLLVGGALLLLAFLEYLLITSGFGKSFFTFFYSKRIYPLIGIGLFWGASSVARNWAHSKKSLEKQYVGLIFYIGVLAIYLLPNIYYAKVHYAPNIFAHSAIITLALVAGITFTAFTIKVNFSFMRQALYICLFVAAGIIISAIIWGFTLGLFFSLAMVLLYSGFVLYDTSNIIYEYRADQYVAASLSLFSSIVFLFYSIMRVMSLIRRIS